jgi:hypothetical protein
MCMNAEVLMHGYGCVTCICLTHSHVQPQGSEAAYLWMRSVDAWVCMRPHAMPDPFSSNPRSVKGLHVCDAECDAWVWIAAPATLLF